jgi:hypothetical protein
VGNHQLVKKYTFNGSISALVTTFDNNYVFVSISDGSLQQICIDSQRIIKDFGGIGGIKINSMAVTRDNKFLITGDYAGSLLKFPIVNQPRTNMFELSFSLFGGKNQGIKEFGIVSPRGISTI